LKPRDTRPVSNRNVDVVREHIGDVDLAAILRDDEAWAARLGDIEPYFAADFEFVAGARDPDPRPGLCRVPRDVSRLDRAVGGLHTGQEIDGPKGMVLYSFSDGRVTCVEYWFDREAGREAVGL
jgi:hypothetical protein